jgi:RimJ/RimL family protein N-acetyltransferase
MESAALLETDRLTLSRLTLADVEEMVALHADPEVRRFLPSAEGYDREHAIGRVRTDEHEWDELGRRVLVVRERTSGHFLGRVGIFDWPQFGETEVGWALGAKARGAGFATEAARACHAWAFEQLEIHYVTALIRADNGPSIKVAERLGMTALREDVLFGTPIVVYSISREDAAAR